MDDYAAESYVCKKAVAHGSWRCPHEETVESFYARPQSSHYDMDLVRSLSDRRLVGVVHVLRPAFLK